MANAKKAVSQVQKMLNTWAIVLIIWSVYRSYFKTDLPIWFDEFIAKPIVFLLPVFYYIQRYEKVAFHKAVDFYLNRKSDILFGIYAGLVVFSFGIAVYFQKTGKIFPEINSSFLVLVA